MDDLGLSGGEFERVLDACRHVRITFCTPPVLQDFIAVQLDQAGHPTLAEQVRLLSVPQMDELCERIRQAQAGRGG
jgi:hypothetical protein